MANTVLSSSCLVIPTVINQCFFCINAKVDLRAAHLHVTESFKLAQSEIMSFLEGKIEDQR